MLSFNGGACLDLAEVREMLKGARHAIMEMDLIDDKSKLMAMNAMGLIDQSLYEVKRISQELSDLKEGR